MSRSIADQVCEQQVGAGNWAGPLPVKAPMHGSKSASAARHSPEWMPTLRRSSCESPKPLCLKLEKLDCVRHLQAAEARMLLGSAAEFGILSCLSCPCSGSESELTR